MKTPIPVLLLAAWSATAQNQVVVAPEVPTNTHNLSVRNIDLALFRVTQEMTMMVSARATAITEDDKGKIDSYFAWLNNLVTTTTASVSDFHYNAVMPLSDIDSVVVQIENPAIQASVNQLLGANVNLRISQSNRLNDSLTPKDKDDLVHALAKAETYIDDFFTVDNPLDMNQSSPYAAVVAPMTLP